MIIRQESGDRWLPVWIGDFEKWQASLLEESARRLGAVLAPGGRSRPTGVKLGLARRRGWRRSGGCVAGRVHPDYEVPVQPKAWAVPMAWAARPSAVN